MILFRIRGISICIEFSFIAVWALVLSISDSSGIIYSLCAVLLHETAHILAMTALGTGLREIAFYGCGIRMRPDIRLIGYGHELAVLIAGPAANIIMWLILDTAGSEQAAAAQLILGTLNLLPCRSLDGGAMLACILSMTRLSQYSVRRILQTAAFITLICAAAAGLFLNIRNFTYYALLLYLFFSEIF